MSQATHIALCLGTENDQRRPSETGSAGYNAIDRDLSLMVIEAVRQCGSSARVCYVSSMGADNPREMPTSRHDTMWSRH